MPTILIDAPPRPEPAEPPRKKWTRVELRTVGIETPERFELIDGDVINKMWKNRPHTNALILVQAWLQKVFGIEHVNPETSIDVASDDNPINEPEPDLIVLSKSSLEIEDGNPVPEDVLLVVEISDSSLRFDLTVKAELYARAGIPEYWVFDILKKRLIVHREPADGRYTQVTAYAIGESVAPLAAQEHQFAVAEAFRRKR